MINQNQQPQHHSNIFSVLAGVFIGGLAGAVTMLLLAPQSGKDTRMQIQEKGIELRDRTTEMVEDTMAKVRLNANKFTVGGREKFEDLKHQGQKLAVGQLDRVAKAAQAGKKAIKTMEKQDE